MCHLYIYLVLKGTDSIEMGKLFLRIIYKSVRCIKIIINIVHDIIFNVPIVQRKLFEESNMCYILNQHVSVSLNIIVGR